MLSPRDILRGPLVLAAFASRVAQDAAMRSVERAIEIALRGPLVDALARDLVRYRVIQRVVDPIVESRAIEEVLERVVSSPEFERVVAEAFDSPAAQRLVAHAIESGVAHEAAARLLESEELWVLVDEIASSPAVTDAISHQSAGLAEQMAVVVRERSRNADARLERIARRALRRGARAAPDGTPSENGT